MPWPWRRKLSVDFIQVPHGPSAAERAASPAGPYTARQVVGFIDAILERQQVHWPEDRNAELIDVLLDLRNMLAAPVAPGGPS